MPSIQLSLQKFLDDLTFGRAEISEELIQEFAENSAKYIKNSLTKREGFTLRVSNLGRPLCQLLAEKQGMKKEPPDNYFSLKMLYGGCVEALVMLLLKASGCNVEAEQIAVKTADDINGTFDCIIDGKLYDVKSCSNYAFSHKFKDRTVQEVFEVDNFGYIEQIFSYARAAKVPVGGLIVVNKETAEIHVLEAEYDEAFENKVFEKIANTIESVNNNEPFTRNYSDYSELYYKRDTGNRVLKVPCTFCNFKNSCWPNLQLRPSLVSTAKNKPLTYYTHIEEAKDDTE